MLGKDPDVGQCLYHTLDKTVSLSLGQFSTWKGGELLLPQPTHWVRRWIKNPERRLATLWETPHNGVCGISQVC